MPWHIRPYNVIDLPAIRSIFGEDEFARPELLRKYPRFSEYLADEMSYYPQFEPESLFVAEGDGRVVGVLSGAVDTKWFGQIYRHRVRPWLIRKTITGAYGTPGWLPAILYTEWAQRGVNAPKVDISQYPAHLHIGILPEWRRKGIGTALMSRFEEYLQSQRVPGYHLFASSYHPLGVAFYQKIGLELLGQFAWRLHTGFEWVNVTEKVYCKRLSWTRLD